jgi:SAM-dependent methyltransferase
MQENEITRWLAWLAAQEQPPELASTGLQVQGLLELLTQSHTTGSPLERKAVMLEALMREQTQQVVEYRSTTVMDEEMIQTTQQSYNRNHEYYSFLYEYAVEMVKRTGKDYFNPFFRQLKLVDTDDPHVFVPGCGHGRDVEQLLGRGVRVTAMDSSILMVESTKARTDYAASVLNGDIRTIGELFYGNNFDGLLAESLLQHVNQEDVLRLTREEFGRWVRPGGPILMRLRVSPTGQVCYIRDGVGERYYSTWKISQIGDLLEQDWFKDQYNLINRWDCGHAAGDSRPYFHALLLERRQQA